MFEEATMHERLSPSALESVVADTVAAPLEGSRSVDELLREFHAMDIPHFQRGLVWEHGNIELLLESLFYNTPCGSIILWTPAAHLLPASPSQPVRYLIVDGQQRLRSLHSVFVAEYGSAETSLFQEDGERASELEDGRRQGVWCLNLGKLPESSEAEFPGGRRFSLFRHAADPRVPLSAGVTGAPLQDREALLPLKWFLGHDDAEIVRLVTEGPDVEIRKAALAVLGNESASRRLREMCRNRVFQVTVLDESRSLADVIGIYNRINTAGKRVEAEERAFAHLVGACEDERAVNHALEVFFERVHGNRRTGRDDLLSRQRENRFGFKLFMRVFTIALAYHTDRSLGSAAFSFDAVNLRTLEKARPALPRIMAATVQALDDVARILSNALYCDDLRMVPSTSSLWPLFQLLIRFPSLAVHAERTLASLAYRLSLAKLRKSELLQLCDDINTATDCVAALGLLDEDPRLTPRAMKRIVKDGVGASQSLTNRYALILYWLLRKRGVLDFSYDANVDRIANLEKLRETYPVEPLLAKNVDAEKQHLVPYTYLKKLFGLSDGPRLGSHLVNDIGNLTYISGKLNGFEIGLGPNAARLEKEPGRNRIAHLLYTESGRLLKFHEKACEATGKSAKKAYQRFCSVRRDLIASALMEWDDELRTDSASEMEALAALPPVSRLVCQRDTDIIQEFGFPASVTAALVRLRSSEDAKGRADDAGGVTFAIVRKKGKKSLQLLRIVVYQTGKIDLKISDERVQQRLMNTCAADRFTRRKSSLKGSLKARQTVTAECLEALLEELAR